MGIEKQKQKKTKKDKLRATFNECQRPWNVECIWTHKFSEVKQHKPRIVLEGWPSKSKAATVASSKH